MKDYKLYDDLSKFEDPVIELSWWGTSGDRYYLMPESIMHVTIPVKLTDGVKVNIAYKDRLFIDAFNLRYYILDLRNQIIEYRNKNGYQDHEDVKFVQLKLLDTTDASRALFESFYFTRKLSDSEKLLQSIQNATSYLCDEVNTFLTEAFKRIVILRNEIRHPYNPKINQIISDAPNHNMCVFIDQMIRYQRNCLDIAESDLLDGTCALYDKSLVITSMGHTFTIPEELVEVPVDEVVTWYDGIMKLGYAEIKTAKDAFAKEATKFF